MSPGETTFIMSRRRVEKKKRNEMKTFIDPHGESLSAFDPLKLLRSSDAAGVQCLAQGHFDMQLMGRAGIDSPPRHTACCIRATVLICGLELGDAGRLLDL